MNWRLLLDESNFNVIYHNKEISIKPDSLLIKSDGSCISVRDLISLIAPTRANELHNNLLFNTNADYNIYKDKFVNLSVYPLQQGISIEIEGNQIPIGYIELKIQFWVEIENIDQTIYKLYRDNNNKVLADIINAKVDYSKEGVYLNIIEKNENKKQGFYLTNENGQKIKLEVDKEIDIRDKNQRIIVMKNPYLK